jgi:hypothetical protein
MKNLALAFLLTAIALVVASVPVHPSGAIGGRAQTMAINCCDDPPPPCWPAGPPCDDQTPASRALNSRRR